MTHPVAPRFLTARVNEALVDTRVVGVVGSRQAGKSTLVQKIVAEADGATYVSLDDRDARLAASNDPDGFVGDRPGLLAIDEVQRVPELLLAIKATVDRDRRPGRFLIVGSSQLSANRGVAETLTGRIERLTLWPFSQGERTSLDTCFLDRLFGGLLPSAFSSRLTKRDHLERAFAGGFPEATTRTASPGNLRLPAYGRSTPAAPARRRSARRPA